MRHPETQHLAAQTGFRDADPSGQLFNVLGGGCPLPWLVPECKPLLNGPPNPACEEFRQGARAPCVNLRAPQQPEDCDEVPDRRQTAPPRSTTRNRPWHRQPGATIATPGCSPPDRPQENPDRHGKSALKACACRASDGAARRSQSGRGKLG